MGVDRVVDFVLMIRQAECIVSEGKTVNNLSEGLLDNVGRVRSIRLSQKRFGVSCQGPGRHDKCRCTRVGRQWRISDQQQ